MLVLREKAEKQFTYKKLVTGLKARAFKKIVVCTGAGISVSAGISDFRSKDVGLYDNLEKMGYKLPSSESIFTLNYFNIKPEPFYKFANDFLDCSKFDPTPTHYFIKMLQDKGIL
jgi:NAD-dependent SIR2 family protein deacetylase